MVDPIKEEQVAMEGLDQNGEEGEGGGGWH